MLYFDVCCLGILREIPCTRLCRLLILRENVQTNYKSNIIRSSGVPKDSHAFFECSNVPFPILFIFSDLNNNLSNCHKQESHTFWNLFFLQCQLTFGRPKINLTVARVCLKICKDLFVLKKL